MDCKEFERQIPDFIEQKMDYRTLTKFMEHLKGCEECKEELSIQFLVREGISRLEDGSSFDLQKELNQRMTAAKVKIRRNDLFLSAGVFLELIAVAFLIGFMIWILL